MVMLMMPDERPAVTLALAALLRAAWSTYRSAVRKALAGGGFDDVPRNGSYVLSAIAHGVAPLSDVIAQLGVSKQAAGQLVDTLVVRGYLDRATDPADRRRLVVSLTERGSAAAAVVRTATDSVDMALEAQVGAEHMTDIRCALAVLASLGGDHA
jgi:DNA-binding MarR family transcriptional regulator